MKFVISIILITNIVFINCDDEGPYDEMDVDNESGGDGDMYGSSTKKSFDGYTPEDMKWRFMIFIMIKKEVTFDTCSGALIKEDLVLSSAHCFFFTDVEPRDILLVGGRSNLEEYLPNRKASDFYDFFNDEPYGTQTLRAKEINIPINYSNDTHFHDIALVKTEEPFSEEKTKVIPWNVGKMNHKRECSVAAYGMVTGFPPKPYVGYIDELDAYPMNLKQCQGDVLAPLICIKTEDTGGCLEHSGGPLVCQGHVWAVGSLAYYDQCKKNAEVFYSALYIDREWLMSVFVDGPAAHSAELTSNLRMIFLCFTLGLLVKAWIK